MFETANRYCEGNESNTCFMTLAFMTVSVLLLVVASCPRGTILFDAHFQYAHEREKLVQSF